MLDLAVISVIALVQIGKQDNDCHNKSKSLKIICP